MIWKVAKKKIAKSGSTAETFVVSRNCITLIYFRFIFLQEEPISEEQKAEKRAQYAVKETEFLRLKRSRLGVDDFEPLKVKKTLSNNGHFLPRNWIESASLCLIYDRSN